MAKSLLRIKARELRSKGESVKTIAKQLSVSRGTASLWVRDIIMTIEQLEKLKQNSLKGAERGRLKSALIQKQNRIQKQQQLILEGRKKLGKLTNKEFFVTGLALYWGEGSKKTRSVQFCNSDPKLINFMIKWLLSFFELGLEDLTAIVGINEIHRQRETVVKDFWSQVTGIPLLQFRKTSFKHALSKKVYSNFDEHFGTLSIRILRPARIYYKIIGLIEALSEAGMKPAFRDVS